MKQRTLWILAGTALVAALVVGWRLSVQRSSSNAAPTTAPQVPAALELTAQDVFTAHTETLSLGLPVSGTLKATQTALIKARVAGELMDLVVREGDAVRAGQVIARIDPTEYQARWQQARQQADSAKAQADIAQKQYDNNEALVQQGFISQTALQTSLLSLSGARAAQRSAEAAADVARKALDDATLKAPISGRISQRLAQPGERLVIDAKVVEIVNLGQFELEAALPAQDAAGVQVGMKAGLQVEGVDLPVTAKVLRINPSTQAGSRSVLVYLGMGGQASLRHGAFAQGTLDTRSVQAIAVPLGSVRTDKPDPYVQVVEAGTVRHVRVEPGPRIQIGPQARVVVTGLPEGARVLAPGVGALREGVNVKVADAPVASR
ncbi:MAG: efflux RND transporter periplasmic adaptor subunit [Limnohabitans sp.]